MARQVNRRSQYVSDKIRDDPSGMKIGVVRALEILDFKRGTPENLEDFRVVEYRKKSQELDFDYYVGF